MTAVEITFDRDSDDGAVTEASYADVVEFISPGFTQRAGGIAEVLTDGYHQIGGLLSSNAQQSVRYYVRRLVDNSSNVVFGSAVDQGDGNTVAQIRVRASESLQARDKFTARYTTPEGVMPLGEWVRVERRYDTSGQTMDTRIFVGANLEGTTPDHESLGDTMNLEPVDGGLSLRIGPTGTATPTATLQFRDFAYDHDGAWIGPKVAAGSGTLRLGGVEPSAIYVGSNPVQAVYLGSTLMFGPGSMDDTFPGTTLDPKWTERDIPGLGTIAVNDGLTLACPASPEGFYNPYGQVPLDRGLIIHQPHDNGDFEVRSNWTVLGGGTTSHGFVFANDDWTSWMRIDMIRFSNRYRWGIIDGSAGQGLWNNEPTLAQVSAPLLLRVGKQGDDWYGQWSIDDGATWDPGFTGITRALDVRHVGLMLGAGNSTAPTTGVDRFEFERL